MSLRKSCQCFVILITLWLQQTTCSATGSNNATVESDIMRSSYELERWLDTTKRPCQNFYGYVCDKSLNVSETELEMERQRKFEEFLVRENDESLMDAELKLKQFFMSCKNARSTEHLKGTLMYRNTGGWPAIDDATEMIRKRRNMTWLSVLGAFHEAGFEYFFKTRIEVKSNKRIVHIEPDDAVRYTPRKFAQLSSEVLQEHHVDAARGRLVELETVIFEYSRREILNAMPKRDELQEFTYESMKTALHGSTLQLEWDAYFKRVLGKTPKDSDVVLVRQLPSLLKYFELLQNTTMKRLLNWIWIDYLMDKNIAECQSLVQSYFGPIHQHIVEHAFIDKVKMAQLYADIGLAYDELLSKSSWIDEMSQGLSKQFHGRVMRLTLNGDSQLDTKLADLTITQRNFYRNLEKIQRHTIQERKRQYQSPTTQSHEVTEMANEFMKIFLNVGALLRQQNLTTPLNYFLVGERFAEYMIASGSTSTTPGAWRSMDSEREFATFRQCLNNQIDRKNDGLSSSPSSSSSSSPNYNPNDLLLRILAQHQAMHALDAWHSNNAILWQRLDRLLAAGRLQLTLRKLYFVGSLLANCHHHDNANGVEQQRQLVHSYLRNSQAFTQAFGCRENDQLYARNPCKVF